MWDGLSMFMLAGGKPANNLSQRIPSISGQIWILCIPRYLPNYKYINRHIFILHAFTNFRGPGVFCAAAGLRDRRLRRGEARLPGQGVATELLLDPFVKAFLCN